jgi:uncharacterized Tic20 family protein
MRDWFESVCENLSIWLRKVRARLKTRAFKDALTEVAVTTGTATLPVWFFPFIALFIVGASYAGGLLDHSVSDGELFLFCTSIVGPLLYTLFRIYEVPEVEGEGRRFKYKISMVFPHAMKFAAIVFFICVTSAAIFGLQKINPSFAGGTLNKTGYIVLSIFLFILSIGSLLIATMLRNEMESYSPSRLMRRQEDEFAEQYRAEEPKL